MCGSSTSTAIVRDLLHVVLKQREDPEQTRMDPRGVIFSKPKHVLSVNVRYLANIMANFNR